MKWFKHDSTANRDAKLEKVLLKYGADGYALYWLCLELIADKIDSTNASFELEHDAELLGARLKIDQLRVEEIMKYFITIELFENDGDRITCLKMAARLENAIVKNPSMKKLQKTICNNPGTSGKTPEKSGTIRELPGTSGKTPEKSGQIRIRLDTDIDTDIIHNTRQDEKNSAEKQIEPEINQHSPPPYDPTDPTRIHRDSETWRKLYHVWMNTPGVPDPGVFRFITVYARQLLPIVDGISNDDLFAAVRNYQDALSRPTWWEARPGIVSWAEKHIDRFLPKNYNPDEYKKKETVQEMNERFVKEAWEALDAAESRNE